MALSKEEKLRIEEEEEYRSQVRSDFHGKKKGSSLLKKIVLGILFVFIGIPLIIGMLIGVFAPSSSSSETPQEERDTSDLVGDVTTNNGYIHVTNTEDKDWKDCFFTINDDYTAPYNYGTQRYTIPAGETSSYAFSDFVDDEGNMFNPYQYKLMTLSAGCESRIGVWQW